MSYSNLTSLRRAVFLISAIGLCLFAASCDDFFVSESSIQSVTISPPGALLQAGAATADSVTFVASAKTVSGSPKSPDTDATWSAAGVDQSSTPVVTVDTQGVVTVTTDSGCQTATITAKDGKSGSATVITYIGATPPTITVVPPNGTTVAPGASFKVTATANLTCSSNQSVSNLVTWSLSSNAAGATIDTQGNVSVPSTATVGSTFTVNAVVQLGKAAGATTLATGTQTFTVG